MLRLGLVVDVRSSRRRLGGGDGGEPLELAGDIATTGLVEILVRKVDIEGQSLLLC